MDTVSDYSLKIGEIEKQSGFPASTLRYYEDIGLVAPPERISGQRHYHPDILKQLAFIKLAQDTGFQLKEIKEILSDSASEINRSEWETLAHQKLAEIDSSIARYSTMKEMLYRGLACKCINLDDCVLFLDKIG